MRNCFVTILSILNAVVMVLKLLTVFALVLFVLVFYNVHIGFNYVYNVYIFHLGLNGDDICLFVSLCFCLCGFKLVYGFICFRTRLTCFYICRNSSMRFKVVTISLRSCCRFDCFECFHKGCCLFIVFAFSKVC